MDPFNTLYSATTPLIDQLESTSTQSLEFLTLQNEILSCIQDLEQSIKTVEENNKNNNNLIDDNPFADINSEELLNRKEKVKILHEKLNNILINKNISNLKGNYGINPFDSNSSSNSNIPIEKLSISQTNPLNKADLIKTDDELDNSTREFHQQLLQQQDDIISNELTDSINTLHSQAIHINSELEFQQDLLNNVEDGMDRLNLKIVNNGMKRINKFLETNEMGGNCCIAILIVVLVIILVLLIIA
jgi:t-SNARE syntaxin family protein